MLFGSALRLLFVGALLFGATGCHRHRDDSKSDFPRSQTIYVGGRQWGEPSSFNPLDSNPAWPVSGLNLLYETLLVYDFLTGEMEPLLAESFREGEDEIEVTLNPAARWSDGKPVTGWDVKYTFDLGQEQKSLQVAPIWTYLSAVTLPELEPKEAPDGGAEAPPPADVVPRRVVFKLNPERKNPLVVLDALQDTRIVPRHVIQPLLAKAGGDINQFLKLKFDTKPVVSGPYQIHSYSSEKIAVVRRDDYWGNQALFDGKKPAAKYVVHPIYKSNDAFSIALQQGRMDLSSSFVPRIWLKQKKGVHSWYEKEPFFVPGCIPMLLINVLHPPLDDSAMRRAMAFAINYKDIRELAVSGYSEPLKPGLIMPFGLEAKYYSKEDAEKYGATRYDPEAAKKVLSEAGYQPVFDEEGELVETRDKDGKKVPTVFIKSPTGWTDWESIVKIAVRSMRNVGIDARERFVDASIFWQALFTADFDMIMNTPASAPTPSKPWSRFEAIMTSEDFAPEGEKMFKNMGRFNDPKAPGYIARVDELLALIPTLEDEKALKDAYRELNVIYMKEQPTLPLVYRPDQFYEFSTRVWKGFPTSENPYTPPQIPGDRLGTRMLWHITSVAQD